jgi:hypothetical protein
MIDFVFCTGVAPFGAPRSTWEAPGASPACHKPHEIPGQFLHERFLTQNSKNRSTSSRCVLTREMKGSTHPSRVSNVWVGSSYHPIVHGQSAKVSPFCARAPARTSDRDLDHGTAENCGLSFFANLRHSAPACSTAVICSPSTPDSPANPR